MRKIFNSLIQKFYKKQDIKTKVLMQNVIFSFVVKGLGMFISLYTLPAYMRFFDEQAVLGVWFTIIAVSAWIYLFDLGIGNGLKNHLIKPLTENNHIEIKKYISSAYITICTMTIILIGIWSFLYSHLNWNIIMNISTEIVKADNLSFAIFITVVGIIFSFLSRLINPIFLAMQKTFIPNLLGLISTICVLIYVLIIPKGSAENNLINLSIAYTVINNVVYIIATVVVFLTKLRKSIPTLKCFSKRHTKEISVLGVLFFWLQILTMILFGTNEYLISQLSSPEHVVIHQIYYKLFATIGSFFILAISPVWTAVAEACAKKDYIWIVKLNKKLNFLALLVIPLELILILFLPIIIKIWLRERAIVIDYSYAFIYMVYSIIYIKVNIDTSVIAGLGKLKIQTCALTTATAIYILLCILLVKFYSNWILVIVSGILALVPYIIIEHFDIKKRFKELKV